MKTLVTKFGNKDIIETILNNKVVAFPTETVYGLGVIYNDFEAFNKLIEAKNRQPDKPFTLMLGKKEDVYKYANINKKTLRIIDNFLPGEITILVKPKDDLYPWVTLKSKYIGIRVPNSKEVCDMINRVGEPMLVSSANISSEPVCNNFEEVYNTFSGKIPLIVKGKTCSNVPSTIVICDEELVLVREGKISFEEIKKEWNMGE